jgi:hypothetical protein
VWGIVAAAIGTEKPKPAGSFEIPAWVFDRGNARVSANADVYADYRDTYPELVAGDGGQVPWVVEYDVDFPVDATYTLHIRYVSAEPRPLELWLDGRKAATCCASVTRAAQHHPYLTKNPHYVHPKSTWDRYGARWEEAAKLSIAKGKHTLKLTRNGPGPNVIALRLESPVAFPKDWKLAGPAVRLPQGKRGQRTRYELGWQSAENREKIARLPAVYRTAFLPPGSVNVATLRLAIEDTIARFGPRYPNGPQYLKQLASLAKRQAAARGGTQEQRQEIADALVSLRRRAMLAHPLLNFEKLLFVKRTTYSSSHIYSDHWDGSKTMGGNLCILSPVAPDGRVTELAPQLAGGLFGRFDLSFDAKKVVFAYKKSKDEGYRIYEIGIDPGAPGGLRQLTLDAPEESQLRARFGEHYRFEDCDPVYLPNGKIMLASTRSRRRVFCFPSTVTSLYVMDADGGNLRCLSEGPVNELAPSVMADGQVLYTRWEYVDKGFGNVQSLWSMYPDGSHSAHVYKSDLVLPAGMIDARTIPGSHRIVTVGAPHCGLSVGPVLLVDNSINRRTAAGMTNLTPELGYPGMSPHPSGRTFGYFKEPYPLSEKYFLVSHNPRPRDRDPTGYGIYVLDAWGNRAELYRDPDISCFQPTPLRPRRRPPVIPSVDQQSETKEKALATLLMQDVYQGMTGIRRGRVKYLRVMEAIGTSWDDGWRSGQQGDGAGLQASAVSLKCDVNIKRIHGIATVHKDGSAHFTVPAEKNLFFQALDKDYMELQRMRTFVNLMPGEKRSCIGCHEHRTWAPGLKSGRPMASSSPAEALRPQPGDTDPRPVHYVLDIRPILDKHCVGCHGGKEPRGVLDLSGELTKLYDRSYESFIDNGRVWRRQCRARAAADVRVASQQAGRADSQGPLQGEPHARGVHQDRHVDRRQRPLLRHAPGQEEPQVERRRGLPAAAVGWRIASSSDRPEPDGVCHPGQPRSYEGETQGDQKHDATLKRPVPGLDRGAGPCGPGDGPCLTGICF